MCSKMIASTHKIQEEDLQEEGAVTCCRCIRLQSADASVMKLCKCNGAHRHAACYHALPGVVPESAPSCTPPSLYLEMPCLIS